MGAPDQPDLLLHGWFERQAQRTPDAIALVAGTTRLTYGELARRVTRLATELQSLGVGPEILVGVHLERSTDLVVAVLAVLTAGGGYVPLDPAYPAERLGFVLADTAAPVVLTQRRLIGGLPPNQARLVCVDEVDWSAPATGPLRSGGQPGQAAYVIYTSGSTGKPKGVVIEHRSAVAFVDWALQVYPPAELAGVLFATSIGFDLSVFELFVTLASGGKVILAQNLLELPTLAAAGEVTLLNTVPSVLRELLNLQPLPASVRVVNLAGEALPTNLVDRLYAAGTVAKVYDLYGPSETTTYSTFTLRTAGAPATIGRPIAHTEIHLLDEHQQPVAAGEVGEIYIAGAGLARGYLNRPELTAERFVTLPSVADGRTRLYRTGDLARWRPTGELEYLGRLDQQVKVRGFRIELGEIEAVLGRLPQVRAAVVAAREVGPGDRQLVGYVVPQAGHTITLATLQEQLRRTLPEHMVPARWRVLDELPLTPNGKVDRKALPAPDEPTTEAGRPEYVAPRTAMEQRVVQWWSELLGVARIGVNDSFLHLGGHSLLALRLIGTVQRETGVRLQLGRVVSGITPAELATEIDSAGFVQGPPALTAAAGPGPFPLSAEQARMLFLQRSLPEGSTYNEVWAWRLEGPVDLERLQGVWWRMVARHEILRTRFFEIDGVPQQEAADVPKTGLDLTDLRDLPPGDRESVAQRHLQREARRPFNLERAPLWRLQAVRLTETEVLVQFTFHHAIIDEWTLRLLFRELADRYSGPLPASAPDTLKRPPLRYADYAVWQQERLRQPDLEEHRRFWREHLAGAPTACELPADVAPPRQATGRGARFRFTLPAGVRQGLEQLGRAEGASAFATGLAAFQVWLARVGAGSDLVVGTPIAQRDQPELASMAGLFLNTLPVRVRLELDQDFRGALRQTRQAVLTTLAHGILPLDEIVRAAGTARTVGTQPLFNVMFVLLNEAWPSLQLPGVRSEAVAIGTGTAKCDLALFLTDDEHGGWRAELEYSLDRFTADSAERFAAQLQTLFAALVETPDRSLRHVRLLPEAERTLLVSAFNRTASDYPRDATLPQLFAEHVARKPDALAVVFQDQSLTYAALEARANQVAHQLRTLGIGPDSVVAVGTERSLELLVALLGVLKAGGAYVPIDAELPVERIRFLLQDCAPVAAVCWAGMAAAITAAGYAGPRVDLTADAALLGSHPVTPPEVELRADHLAQVLFTSGSTGRPKGVCLPHRGIVRLVRNTNYATYGSDDVFLQLAPVSFDASTLEIWGCLLNGGRLIVMPPGPTALAELAKALERHQVTFLFLTAGLFRQMVDEQLPALRRVRQVLTGGDIVPAPPVRRLLAAGCPSVGNAYGPTENSTVTTCHVLTQAEEVGDSVPIGRPIANTQVYLLDSARELVPLGVAGELYTGGDGLARGYLNRPELTAEKFVSNPFSEAPDGRLYRTGDQARWRRDGTLEFLGRLDQQVKIRGFRVELEEIERTLAGHPAIRQVVVIARETKDGGKQLLAYVATHPDAATKAVDFRDYLRARLPDYLVPAAFVVLEQLPLTPNGKVDRLALPAPDLAGEANRTEFVAPRTPTEELVGGIWGQLLGVERVSRTDNFFELGGHSLLATRMVSRVNRGLRLEVPLRRLFEQPTLAGFAGELDELRVVATVPRLPPLTAAPPGTEPVASFAQLRLWFLDQYQPAEAVYNLPLAVRITGALEPERLRRSLEMIVHRHAGLRTVFRSEAGQPRLEVRPPTPFELSVTDLEPLPTGEREAAARTEMLREARRPFDLAAGPLLRARLVRLSAEDFRLVVTQHHIVSDGWSVGVLFHELAVLYESFPAGPTPPLPGLPIQYSDFAGWQRDWLQGELLDRQLSYWTRQLAGAPALLELPLDRPRPAHQTYPGATVTRDLPAQLVTALDQLARASGVTRFMLLLAAFQTLLHRISRQDDLVVGAPIAGRNQPETEGLVGLFVNTLALRTDLSGRPSFRDLLDRVRRTVLEAFAHQDLPFERLVEAMKVSRSTSYSPLFQVMFALQNLPLTPVTFGGLTLEPAEVDTATAKFDLTLMVEERPAGLRVRLEFNTDLFNQLTAEGWLRHWETLLRGIAANPDQPVDRIPLLEEAERQELLVGWNRTELDYPRGQTLPQLITSQAVRTPTAVAVVDGQRRLTYGELEARTHQLARRLQALGVGPEVRVAVCAERSLELVVGLVGILKSGGAYVPLDPAYPSERLRFMLEDTAARVIVTQRSLVAGLPPHEATVLCLDEMDGSAGADPSPLAVAPRPDDLAYLIYTSGSTGRPKGVALEHRNAVAFVHWAQQVFSPDELAGVLFSTSICFDLSAFELFVTLSSGGKVIVAPHALELPTLPAAHEVTLVNTVPSALRELVSLRAIPSSVRVVNLAGEPLPTSLVEQLLALAPGIKVYDLYGPSETTTYSTFTRRYAGAPATIGRPVANTQVYVVDAWLEPVPVGVPGELLIGGAGVARGYLNRPELTAEKFIPNPFRPDPADRVYRTGDLARWRTDGTLEFLGRLDHQVKVRGFRVEPGEIEAVLGRHPSISATVVVPREISPGDLRLVAYVVIRAGHSWDREALRTHLRGSLPEYLVPEFFVALPELPLTPNGKVNRAALPLPGPTAGEVKDYVAPRTPLEERVARIWSGVLRLDRVGAEDNFFELGGHSLLALRMLGRVREEFGQAVSLRVLFESPTVAGLARAVNLESTVQARTVPPECRSLTVLQPAGRRPPLFIFPGGNGGERELYVYAHLAQHHLGADQPVFAFQRRGWDGRAGPHTSLDQMTRDYLAELRTVQPEGPYFLLGDCTGGNVAFALACLLQNEGEVVGMLALADSTLPDGGDYRRHWWESRYRRFRHGRAGRILFNFPRLFALVTPSGRTWLSKKLARRSTAGVPADRTVPADRAPSGEYWCRDGERYLRVLTRRPTRTFNGRLHLIVSEGSGRDPQILAWGRHATQGAEVRELPGDHWHYLWEGASEAARWIRQLIPAPSHPNPDGPVNRVDPSSRPA